MIRIFVQDRAIPGEAVDGSAVFLGVLTARPPRRWPAATASLALHCLAAVAGPGLLQHFGPDEDDIEATRIARLERMRSGRERITYTPRPQLRERAATIPARGPDHTVPAPGEPGLPRRRIQLPELSRKATEQQTLLQPDLPERTIANLRLPEFLYWSAKAPAVARPVKRFVVPGRELLKADPLQLAEPPKVAQPGASNGLTATDLAKAIVVNPRLPLPPSLGAPLRAGPAAQLPSPATIDALPGDASAILSLHPNPPPLGATIAVPPANQVGILPGDQGGPDGAAITAQLRGSGGGTGPGAGGPSPAPGTVGGSLGGRGGAGNGGSGDGGGGSPALLALASSVPIRTLHPENGAFDIVVMQSSLGPDLAEADGVLSGRPVYTVYLKPAGGGEWILRFCAADGAPAVRTSAVSVQLGNPRPIRAPYTRATVVPSVPIPAGKRGTLIHGYLTAVGQFRGLRAVRAEDAELVASLEPFLRQWDFRPASRSGAAIEVEILLVIPPARS